MHRVIQGAPRLTAQGHELMAELHRESADELHKAADEMPPGDPDALEIQPVAARQEGAAAGHAFRVAELRYDARGGLTLEQARRRFEPGAKWTLHGEPLDVVAHDENGVRLDHPTSVDGVWSLTCLMKRSQGWRLVALAPAATGDDST